MTVRTRIAPSPTGDPHVGTAYIALFNWAFARSRNGKFILRVEDTDLARSTVESERSILQALAWLGLDWDEGPDVGGEVGPYRQSERKAHYHQYVEQLVEDGHAFYCFCTPERLESMRAEQMAAGGNSGYDGRCLELSAAQVAQRRSAGEPVVVRMKVPADGDCEFEDLLRGTISIPYSQIDMQVLLKADGFPTYHLAVVVDDHMMGITHVLRGEEWINSVPKHKLLYEYFGWHMPVHVHLPLLRNPDQSKLSKRRNPTSIHYYRDEGFLPEALLNYLALMGWSMPDESEVFDKLGFVEAFDIERISLGGPVFDLEKLAWLNGQYLRALTPEAFMERVAHWALNRDRLGELVPLVQERTEKLSDLAGQVDYLLGARRSLVPADFEHPRLTEEDIARVLHHVSRFLDELRFWQRDRLFNGAKFLADAVDLKIRDFLFPLFVALSGRPVALPLFDSLMFLGPDLSRARVRDALRVVGASKKRTRQLDKDYDSIMRGFGES